MQRRLRWLEQGAGSKGRHQKGLKDTLKDRGLQLGFGFLIGDRPKRAKYNKIGEGRGSQDLLFTRL